MVVSSFNSSGGAVFLGALPLAFTGDLVSWVAVSLWDVPSM